MYIKKITSSQNNPEKFYTEKKARHEPSVWALYTRWSFNNNKKKSLITVEEKIVLKNYVKN